MGLDWTHSAMLIHSLAVQIVAIAWKVARPRRLFSLPLEVAVEIARAELRVVLHTAAEIELAADAVAVHCNRAWRAVQRVRMRDRWVHPEISARSAGARW